MVTSRNSVSIVTFVHVIAGWDSFQDIINKNIDALEIAETKTDSFSFYTISTGRLCKPI